METLYYTVALLNIALYGRAFLLHSDVFFKVQKPSFEHYTYYTLGVVTHVLLLFLLAFINNRCPLANSGEALLFFSFLFSITYMIPYFLFQRKELAVFFFLPILMPSIISLILIEPVSTTPAFYDSYFSFHIIVSLTAYCCLTVSSLFSLMYLWFLKKLKNRDFGLTFQRFPSLNEQELFSVIWLVLGVILMFVASFVGRLWIMAYSSQLKFDNVILVVLSLLLAFTVLIILKTMNVVSLVWFHRFNIFLLFSLILIQTVGIHGFK